MARDKPDALSAFRLSEELPPQYETTEVNQHSLPASTNVTPKRGRSLELLNENSPLLAPQYLDDDDSPLQRSSTPAGRLDWNDGEAEESKSVWYLFLLTLSIGG